MLNEEGNPECAAPPAADQRAVPGSQFNNLYSAAAFRFAAGLLLAAVGLSLLWQAGLLPVKRAGREPLPVGTVPPGGQASPGGAPEQAPPEYGDGAGTEHLAAASGGAREENLVPPAPGLLMPQLPTLKTITYTGPSNAGPAEVAKETAEDRAGCAAGDMFKCLRLGGRYVAAYGVERDAERGFSLINRACAGGIAEACTTQGIMQLSGHGTARDVPAGVALCDKACAAGDMYGCSMLAGIYLEGRHAPADIPRGLGLLRRACAAKLAVSCSLLGMIYAEGKGVPRDPAAAERLLGEACGLNDKNACQLQQQLAQKRAAGEKSR